MTDLFEITMETEQMTHADVERVRALILPEQLPTIQHTSLCVESICLCAGKL